ncbi:MAG: hypothetical protein EBY22_05710 [Gammaproteobacteria bacterium]|nr:hypothetical protein [Gammaproteobacteria bacterium]
MQLLLREMSTLDPTSSKDSTPVGQFRLNYHTISKEDFRQMRNCEIPKNTPFYFVRSQDYFLIKLNAVAKDNNRSDDDLPIMITKKFSLREHAAIVKDHTNLYKEKSNALVLNDKKMWSALLIAVIAPNIPFIPFLGLVAFVAWMATFYFLNQRATLNTDYKDARTLLIATCNWALGPNSDSRNNLISELTNSQEIKAMMDELFPVLSKTQVKHLIADDIERQYTDALEARAQRTKIPLATFFSNNPSRAAQSVSRELEETALKQSTAEVIRCIYGHNRGENEMDLLRVVSNFICVDIGRALSKAATAYFTPEVHSTSLA